MNMKAIDLLQRCLGEIDCDIYSDPVTLELVQDVKDYLAAQSDSVITGNKVISSDSGITITAVQVSDSAREALSTDGAKLPPLTAYDLSDSEWEELDK